MTIETTIANAIARSQSHSEIDHIMKIEVDTTSLGTPEQPAFLVFPKYGYMPATTVILAAATMEEAITEVAQRFGVKR